MLLSLRSLLWHILLLLFQKKKREKKGGVRAVRGAKNKSDFQRMPDRLRATVYSYYFVSVAKDYSL
jgi:hypothetical protein